MSQLRPIRTILEVKSGTSIADANVEAVVYAGTNHINVQYNHNGTTYEVIFNDLIVIPKKMKI